jgi:hypothetical protein
MGMDIYGLKPKVKGKRPEIDWNKPTTEEERNKYFKKLEKFEAENVGYYFRKQCLVLATSCKFNHCT